MGTKVNTKRKDEIIRLKQGGKTFEEISKIMGIATGTVKTHYYLSQGQPSYHLPESKYPRFDNPPVLEGDWLVLPDCEIPFHHAEFINRCIDLAVVWGIKNLCLAGDAAHYDSLSGWEPSWKEKSNGGLSDADKEKLTNFIIDLPAKYQDDAFNLIEDIGEKQADGGYSEEMKHARNTLKCFNEWFNDIVWVLGNHEGRSSGR